jgi:hypothetical protein
MKRLSPKPKVLGYSKRLLRCLRFGMLAAQAPEKYMSKPQDGVMVGMH